jgi:hypothetical protein
MVLLSHGKAVLASVVIIHLRIDTYTSIMKPQSSYINQQHASIAVEVNVLIWLKNVIVYCRYTSCVLFFVGIDRRLLLRSTVGSCWDRSSALARIDRRLLLGSTVGSCWDRPSELRSARTLNLTQQTEEEEDEQ